RPDALGRAPAPFREQISERTTPPGDVLEEPEHPRAVPEAEPPRRLLELPRGEQPALRAFHGERDRPSGRDRVEPERVAGARRREHHVRLSHAAERPQREHVLVLGPHRPLPRRDLEEVLAPDRAVRARPSPPLSEHLELLAGELARALEGALPEIPRGK